MDIVHVCDIEEQETKVTDIIVWLHIEGLGQDHHSGDEDVQEHGLRHAYEEGIDN